MSKKSETSHPTHSFTAHDATPLDITALGKRAVGDVNGDTAIKYALIAAGMGAAVAATVFSLGTTSAILYQSVANLF